MRSWNDVRKDVVVAVKLDECVAGEVQELNEAGGAKGRLLFVRRDNDYNNTRDA